MEDAYNHEWCYIHGSGCGIRGWRGEWDYCLVDSGPQENLPWEDKLTNLWAAVQANTTIGAIHTPGGLFSQSMWPTFLHAQNTLPVGRQKLIHSVGLVCPFTWKMSVQSPFSGLFQAGTVTRGLVRLGSALEVTLHSGIVPGIGIKLLRSGVVASGNLVALSLLEPTTNYNFFARPLSNHISVPKSARNRLGAAKFAQVSREPNKVGLSDICQYTQDGDLVASVQFPFKVVLTSSLRMSRLPRTLLQWNMELVSAIPSGSVLYVVTAFTSRNESVVLGQIVTDAECVTSAFGDSSLFFQHQRIEDDWMVRPDFRP